MKVVPAILEKDFEMIETKVCSARENGLSEVQIDVADGIFVPNKTYDDLETIKKMNIKIEAHLMVTDCLQQLRLWKKADNISRVIIHLEALTKEEISEIIRTKEKIAIAVNPVTPIESAYDLISLGLIEHILFMGVTPGFSGQEFHPEVVEKMRKFKKQVKSGITCAIDGGVNDTTAKLVRDYVNWLNASSFIWNGDGTINWINLNYLKSL